MTLSNLFSTKKKICLISISLLAILLASGALTSSYAIGANNAQTNPTSAGSGQGLPSSSTNTLYGNHPVTSAGPASKFLLGGVLGPFKPLPPSSFSPNFRVSSVKTLPQLNPRPATTNNELKGSPTVPPVVSCKPSSSSCATVANNAGGAVGNPNGVNAVDSGGSYGFDIEPPDQSVCSGAGYVVQAENLGELRVFNSNLGGGSAVITLDSLMGLTTIPSSIGGPWSSGGDISCLYDYSNGGHWFVTEIVSNSSEASGGTFVGCFAAKFDGCFEGIAVSVSRNPLGAWNVYFLNPNAVNNDPGQHYLLNDFGKIGNTQDAFLISYDEFILNGAAIPPCPAFGCFGFNGAQQFAINKNALELGFPVTSPYLNVAYENMGLDPALYPVPADSPFQTAPASCFSGTYIGFVCWYQVIPAMSPDPTQFDNLNGGTGFMLAGLDFFGNGDNRLAAFDWTGLHNLVSIGCSTCGSIMFGGQIMNHLNVYKDEGAGCPASSGGSCGLGAQKVGQTPLGDNCVARGLSSSPCTEGGIATNFDGITQVSFAHGAIWGGVSTLITQQFGKSSETHVGVSYWGVSANRFDATGKFAVVAQGYVTAMHEDIEFPGMAATDGGQVLMSFTLSGPDYYPSSAYGWLSQSSRGLSPNTIHVADMGRSPQDGFSEYQQPLRPRWGDYGAAIFVPNSPGTSNGRVYFATELINAPQCTSSQFLKDPSCGMTRDPFANWGNSINYIAT